MRKRSLTWWARVPALLLVAQLGAMPARAGDTDFELDGMENVFNYVACGASIAGISTGFGLVSAMVFCGRLIYHELT